MKFKKEIINALKQNGSLNEKELSVLLRVKKKEARKLHTALLRLLEEGTISVTRRGKYKLKKVTQAVYVTGRLAGNKRGFAFLIREDGAGEDVFIPAQRLAGALHGDTVRASIAPHHYNGQEGIEGTVVEILQRANDTIVGIFEEQSNGGGCVLPADERINLQIVIPPKHAKKAQDGQKVVAVILNYGAKGYAQGRIERVLGYAEDKGVNVSALLYQNGIRMEFPPKAKRQAELAPQQVSEEELAGRTDLRRQTIFTIDGADAKDLDDAVSIEELSDGNLRLGVHIADVSHYVAQHSPLDKEALLRGNSVYPVDRVVPMLREELSNGICSLNPKADRLTLSCIMDINPSGETVSYSIHKSVIHTTERMTYVDVQKILEDDAQMLARYAHIQQDIKRMERLANILSARRKRRGSIDFNTSEAKITLKEDGTPDTITRVERLFAHRLIEEFMLAANETVAKHIALKNGPFVYRVHEVMGEEKARELMTFLGAFGIDLTKDASQVKPMEVQQALLAAQGKKEERLINITVLRAMKKARYAAENLGHFGLAATYYCHFTSPIRRYPDLMVHRMLKKDIAGELNKDGQTADEKMRMEEIAVQCSACELRAMEAERAVESYMKAKYMEQRLGEIYDGVISGITPNGVFVELDNTIEGFVRLEDLGRELRYEKESYRFVDASGRVISIGQPMRVQVAAANAELRRIDFVPVADTDPQVS